jgi:hypothetical protein
LAQRSPLVGRFFWRGLFLNRTSAKFDLAVTAVVLAAVTRKPLVLVLALPWVRARWWLARHFMRGDRSRALPVLAGYAVSDSVALASMIEGSVRHRRLLL